MDAEHDAPTELVISLTLIGYKHLAPNGAKSD